MVKLNENRSKICLAFVSTRARSGSRPISKNSHTSTEGPGQGIALDPTGPWQGFTPEPRGQRQGLTPGAHGSLLGKDSHPSPQRPRHGLKTEPSSPRQGFSVSPQGLNLHSSRHGPRQRLAPELASS